MVLAEIPYKAQIKLKDSVVTVKGSKALIDKVGLLKAQYGPDPQNWPEQSVMSGEDILINEFILKARFKFSFCYNHEELCHCRNVTTDKVFDAIKNNCFRVEDVSTATLAGTGCGSCKKDIGELIKQFKKS